jgi:hypothetical protein
MRKAILIPVGIALTLGAAYFCGLAYVKHRAIQEAANHGVTLGIERVRFGVDGIHLENVTATSVQLASTTVHIDEIAASYDAENVSANGVEAKADGPIKPANGSSDQPLTDGQGGPNVIHVRAAHFVWTHVFGDASLELTNANGDLPLAQGPRGPLDVTWTTDVTATFQNKKFGPFSAEFELGQERTLTVFLDPSDHDDAFVRVSHFGDANLHYEAHITSRPLSKIGIPTSALGVQVAGDPNISLRLNDEVDRARASGPYASGSIDFRTDPIALPGLKQPGAIALSMNWSGNPDQPMPLNADPKITGSSLSVGPFKGPVTGTISRPDGAVVLDLAFVSQPVPCSQFSSGNALLDLIGSEPVGGLTSLMGAKAQVTGDVKLSGSVQFDSRNPASRHVSFTPVTTCGFSISLGTDGK